ARRWRPHRSTGQRGQEPVRVLSNRAPYAHRPRIRGSAAERLPQVEQLVVGVRAGAECDAGEAVHVAEDDVELDGAVLEPAAQRGRRAPRNEFHRARWYTYARIRD